MVSFSSFHPVFQKRFISQAKCNLRAGWEKLGKPDTKGMPHFSLDKDLA